MSNISPFARPVYVMLKPVGSVCNLACDYCYYLEKDKLYPDVKNHILTDELLEKFIQQYMECSSNNIWNARRCRKSCLPGMAEKH